MGDCRTERPGGADFWVHQLGGPELEAWHEGVGSPKRRLKAGGVAVKTKEQPMLCNAEGWHKTHAVTAGTRYSV